MSKELNSKRKIFFRADGSAAIGLGHVIRSCALADMLKEHFECHFFIREPSDALQQEIKKSCKYIHPLPDSVSFSEEAANLMNELSGDEILVLDGYRFDTAYQAKLVTSGCKLVCIDDIHSYHFLADVVINHAGGLSRNDYSLSPFTQLFLGPSYALLRKEFLQAAKHQDEEKKDEIFISMGGGDINNDILHVLKLLEQKQVRSTCNIVLGSAYTRQSELNAFLQQSALITTITRNATPDQMAALMKRSKYAICAPSSVSFEYLSVGGELYLKQTADNQKDVLAFFLKQQLAFSVEEFGLVDDERILESKQIQKHYFDGQSDFRFQKIFTRLTEECSVSIRSANEADVNLYYEWANDPEVRAGALNSAPIPMLDHINWFRAKCEDENSYMYVVSKENKPLGQVRFDVDRNLGTAIISYSIDSSFRNKGWGTSLMRVAGRTFIKDLGKQILLKAVVKKENIASNKVFENLGFHAEPDDVFKGVLCNVYSYWITANKPDLIIE